MREVITSIEIKADRDTVWAALTDFHAYPEWNPFITRISGPVQVGRNLQVHMAFDNTKGFMFRPVVRRVTPLSELVWMGHLWLPGLFDGEHHFRLEPCGEGVTRFVQSERFSGLLATLWGWTFRAKVEANFNRMNQALRTRVQTLSPTIRSKSEDTNRLGDNRKPRRPTPRARV